jgi:hypothetical protein
MKPRGLTVTRLKALGLVFVVLSALGTAVVQRDMPADLAQADFSQLTFAVVVEALSWTAVPIYAWLVFAGYRRTMSRRAYGLRLLALAAVSEVPYDLATSHRLWDMTSQNPVWALLVAVAVLALLDRVPSRAAAALVILAAGFWLVFFAVGLRFGLMPLGVLTLAFVLVFHYFHARENTMMFVGATLGALALVFPAMGFVFLHYRNEDAPAPRGVRLVFYALYPVVLLGAGLAGAWV